MVVHYPPFSATLGTYWNQESGMNTHSVLFWTIAAFWELMIGIRQDGLFYLVISREVQTIYDIE